MKYLGIFAIIFAAVAFSREYARYMKKRRAECEGFLAFIKHARIQIGCFLKPVRELGDGFRSEALGSVGFLAALRESEDIFQAYKRIEPRLSLSPEERAVTAELFSSLGLGYLNDGLKLIDSSCDTLAQLCDKLKDEQKKNTRLVSSLAVTLALGFLIIAV